MKVAVVFAGQPRLFRKTFQSHLDFLISEAMILKFYSCLERPVVSDKTHSASMIKILKLKTQKN